MSEQTLRIGIIGCGAVTEFFHLRAAARVEEVRVTLLVDNNRSRAETLAHQHNVPYVAEDYSHVWDKADAAIVALPHCLHAPVSMDLLAHSVHVFVEKPMALTAEEAQAMVKTADANGVVLQIGQMLRFGYGPRLLKQAIAEGWLGTLQNFSLEMGFVYNWPVASGFFFSKEQAGGGVLVDTGSHMLDLLLWWLGDVIDVVEYRDDSLGGVEAECWLSLVLQTPTGPVQGNIILSRLRKLRNTARIVGERFTIECDFSDKVRIWPSTCDGRGLSFVSDTSSLPRQSSNVYMEELRAFARAIVTGDKSVVPGESVLGSIALMERCYRERQPLELPWMRPVLPTQCQLG